MNGRVGLYIIIIEHRADDWIKMVRDKDLEEFRL